MTKAIARQKDLIKDKEKKIEEKNLELQELQVRNKEELKRLEEQYDEEHLRKEELDRKLKAVKAELSNIE